MAQQPPYSLSPGQQRLVIAVDRAIYRIARHWLWLANGVGALVVGLPLLAPLLVATGHDRAALWIYRTFNLVCHQQPDRSFTVFGEQMAYCQRDTAIYGGILLLGLLYAGLRKRLRPLSLRGAALLAVPMAVDGFSQLFGLRESTWELRVVTGGLFAVAVAWVVFPRLEAGFAEIQQTLEARFARLVREGRARPL